jgi:acyl transferase
MSLEDPKRRIEAVDIDCGGRRIHAVVDRPDAPDRSAAPRIAVVSPGFTREFHHSAFIGATLRENGFTVYRYEPLDHVGLSDGDLLHHTLSGAEVSLAAVCRHVAAAEGVERVGIVATSLSARVALRHAARSDLAAYVIAALGVYDVNRTLAKVFGYDLIETEGRGIPDRFQFEGHEILSGPFVSDAQRGGWLTTEGTARDISEARCPLRFLVAADDDWVSADGFIEFIDGLLRPTDRVFRVGSIGHEVTRNPQVAARLVSTIVGLAISAAEGDVETDVADVPVREVEFQDLIRQRILERRYAREAEARIAGEQA